MLRKTGFFLKFISSVLAVVMLLGLFACDSSEKPEPEDTANVSESDDQPVPETDPLDGLNYKGEVFTIHTSTNVIGSLTNSFKSSNYLIQGEEEMQSDKAANSAYKRNKLVEEKLNIKLNYIESNYEYNEVTTNVRELIKSGADDIGLIINDIRTIVLATEGLLHDARYGSYFDFSKPYWYDDLMASACLNDNTRFALMGDYFIDILRYTNCLLFNKDLYTRFGCDGESIYDIVRDGDWTFDTMMAMLQGGEGYPYTSTYIDATGNRKRDRRDTYGLVMHDWWGPMIPFMTAADPGYISRNEEGYPEITTYNERTISLHDKMMKMLYLDETGIGKVFNFDNDDTILAFVEDRALILGGEMVGSLESSVYADSEVNFAILPYPKLDDMQKDYISPIHDTAEIGFIPATLSIENLQVASAVIEALSRETVNTVIPDYYESTLKIRYARESANAEMLELIHDHYNSAFVVAWTVSVNNYFLEGIYSSVYQNSNTFTSYCRMYESAAQETLRELIFNQELVIEQMEDQYGKLTN